MNIRLQNSDVYYNVPLKGDNFTEQSGAWSYGDNGGLNNDSQYLQCDSSGHVSTPINLAYGTWEFDFYNYSLSTRLYFAFISDGVLSGLLNSSFLLYVGANNEVWMRKTGSSVGTPMLSANGYISNETWYSFKITRTTDGEFTVYIKGGAFGNDWVLISADGGSNPFTDTDYPTSNNIVVTQYANTKIANIKYSKEIADETKHIGIIE